MGVCRHPGMRKTRRHPKNAGNTAHCGVSAVYPRDCVVDWELRSQPLLSITIALHIASWGNYQNPKFNVWFLLNADRFCAVAKLENSRLKPLWDGTICTVHPHSAFLRLWIPLCTAFTRNPKTNAPGTCAVIVSCQSRRGPVPLGPTRWHSAFCALAHTVNQCPFCSLLSAKCFCVLCVFCFGFGLFFVFCNSAA